MAVLCMLRLLGELPASARPSVRCITFACPAIGNAALADLVKSRGWASFFTNLLVPEDVIPRLLGSPAAVSRASTAGLLQPTTDSQGSASHASNHSPGHSPDQMTQDLLDYLAQNPGILALSPIDSSMSMDSLSSLDASVDWEGMDGEANAEAGTRRGLPARPASSLMTFFRRQAAGLARGRAALADLSRPHGAGLPAAFAAPEAAAEGVLEEGIASAVPQSNSTDAAFGASAAPVEGGDPGVEGSEEAGSEAPASEWREQGGAGAEKAAFPAAELAQRYMRDAIEQSEPRSSIGALLTWLLGSSHFFCSEALGFGMDRPGGWVRP